jgi:hypothetical protein
LPENLVAARCGRKPALPMSDVVELDIFYSEIILFRFWM